jgi:hypothetical protein
MGSNPTLVLFNKHKRQKTKKGSEPPATEHVFSSSYVPFQIFSQF